MARATVAVAVAAALCLVAVVAGYHGASTARRSALAGGSPPTGWWQTLRVKGGKFCALRDFPPIPDGYGSNRVYCPDTYYDHYWMWRVEKASGSGSVSSGDEVYLTTYQPMLKYCTYTNMVMCGVGSSKATKFVLEKETGTGTIDFATDFFNLKLGNKYCSLTVVPPKKPHGQSLVCTSTNKKTATVFQMPYSNFASIQLVTAYTTPTVNDTLPNGARNYVPAHNNACGGDFYGQFDNETVSYAGCRDYFAGMAINMTVALRTPGAPVIQSGTNITVKAYDDLYTYQVSTWKVDTDKKVFLEENDTEGKNQWFTIVKTNVVKGNNDLTNGTLVALLSTNTSMYCGFQIDNPNVLACDKPASSVASLPVTYTYMYVINQ